MNRIIYAFLFVLISVAAKSQTLAVSTQSNDACINQSIWLKASGHDLYVWSDSVRLDTIIGDSVNFSSAVSGNYSITVLGYTVFPADTDTMSVTITVHGNPAITINSSANSANNFICLGDTAILDALGNNLVSYAWSPAISTTDSMAQSTGVFPTSNVTYTVTVTDVYGCQNTSSKQVKVNPTSPSITMEVANSVICPGGSTKIVAQGNGLQFEWTPAASLNVSNAKEVIASPMTTTTYQVTATLNACKTVASTTVNVLDAPNLTVSESTNGASICLDSTAIITAVCPDCIYYVYNFPNSSVQTTSTTQVVSPNIPGAIDILVQGIGENTCKSVETVTINVSDCFNGTPFSIEELTAADIQVAKKGSRLNVVAPVELTAVEVYNLLGEMVINVKAINKSSVSLDASTFGAGVYVVMVKSDLGNVAKKVYLN